MSTIQEMKDKATFNQDALDAALEAAKARYEGVEAFTFNTPTALMNGLFDLFTQGYKPADHFHQFISPSFFQAWVVKPEAKQQEEILVILDSLESRYRADVQQHRLDYLEAAAHAQLKAEKEKAAARLALADQKRYTEIVEALKGSI
jgi:hypothetical protein